MALSAGDKLGHYEILSLLGEGGMGHVYRARDTSLKREVALKVLPPTFIRDEERMARFQREAEVLASLDHPNIGQIHGIVESDESRGLVLALIEGRTLADRIDGERLPLAEAVAIAKQIVDALEYAHDRGVIHRDLKPANIKITPDGVVKVLDFGLAKVLDVEPTGTRLGDSPTVTLGHTRAGVIMGTAAYMSAEQAVGRPVDRRSDIFSFGAVFYEMLTGQPAFCGATTPDVLEAVLKEDPDWSKLPERTPPAIRHLLIRCLTKDRKVRLQAIGEARIILDNPGPASAIMATGTNAQHSTLAWVAAALLGLAAMALAWVHFRETPPQRPLITSTILAPDDSKFETGGGFLPPEISPDGRRLVFGVRTAGKVQLWLRSLDSPNARPLAGTDDPSHPFWSPDSQSIGFFADSKLKRMDVSGGPPRTLADAPFGRGASWSSKGVIVFAPVSGGRPLQQIPAAGGAASNIQGIERAMSSSLPSFLPDGSHFLFVREQAGVRTLQIASLLSNEVKTVGPADSKGIYANGRLLFLGESTLMAQPFDEKTLSTVGDAAPMAERVGSFSVSRDGVLAYTAGGGPSVQQLTWFDRDGKVGGTFGAPSDFGRIEFSRDQKSLAVEIRGRKNDLWIYDIARELPSRFAGSTFRDRSPIWSPDGASLVFTSNPTGPAQLFRKSADGVGPSRELLAERADTVPTSWSPDGKFILFHRSDLSSGNRDVWVLPVPADPLEKPKPLPFLTTPYRELMAVFSPDGRWVAYQSDESKQFEIYVTAFPGPAGKHQISIGGGRNPRWRADGKEIFYVSPEERLMSTEIAFRGAIVEVGRTHALEIPISSGGILYETAADGQRFLVAVPVTQKSPPMTLVDNWPLLLRK